MLLFYIALQDFVLFHRVFRISDILECVQGVHYDAVKSAAPRDESCYLTIACNPSRYIALLLDTRDDRNSLVTGLRTLVSDIHVSSTNVDMGGGDSGGKSGGRRSSFKEGVMADAAAVVAARESKEGGGKPGRRMSRRASLNTAGHASKPVFIRISYECEAVL